MSKLGNGKARAALERLRDGLVMGCSRFTLAHLRAQGWIAPARGGWRLTEAGHAALASS